MISTSTIFASKNISSGNNNENINWTKFNDRIIPVSFSKWIFAEIQMPTTESWFDANLAQKSWKSLASLNQTEAKYSEALESAAEYYLENIALVNQSILSCNSSAVVLAAFPYSIMEYDEEVKTILLPKTTDSSEYEEFEYKQWLFDEGNALLRKVDEYLQSHKSEYLEILEDLAYKYPFTHNRVSYSSWAIRLTSNKIEEELMHTLKPVNTEKGLKGSTIYDSLVLVTKRNSPEAHNGFEYPASCEGKVKELCKELSKVMLTRFNIAACWLAKNYGIITEMNHEFLWGYASLQIKSLKDLNMNEKGVKVWHRN